MNDNLKALLHYIVPNAVGVVQFFVVLHLDFLKNSFGELGQVGLGLLAYRYMANDVEAKLDAYIGYGQEDAQSPLVEPMTTELVSEV